ncbi:hypothetical protein ACFQ0P_13950 [Microbacterium insulae]|uniref:Uncharacterized protein n=1 Tax=Microbacterium insulae TaxID=483014 RepID=A0ABW3AKR9_9MICO
MSLRDEIAAAANAMLAITSPPVVPCREEGHPVNDATPDRIPDERTSA